MSTLLKAARPIVIDSLGVILFAVLTAMHVNLVVAVAASASTAVGVVLWHLATRRPIGSLQWISLALVVIAGGATLLTSDPRFVMAKATVVYAAVGAFMLRRGWMNHYLPAGSPLSRSPEGSRLLTRFGYIWAGLMFATAAANLIVAMAFTPWWPAFIGTVPLASKITLFLVQFAAMRGLSRDRAEALPVTVSGA